MGGRKWTKQQEAAIYTKRLKNGESCNILVNAAAGSGKTAVLVERIIKKLIGEREKPVDVDRLLVVTFTNAAAAEMKDRISAALSERTEQAAEEGDVVLEEILKHQSSLLYSADITTIDAFCMKTVRENFHLLGIDPSFGIADNAQLALMADEAMEELFDDCCENGNEDYYRLADMYSDGRDDSALAEMINEVYDFIRAMPNPKEWLEEKAEMYLNADRDNPWFKTVLEKKNSLCSRACADLKKAMLYMSDYLQLGFDDADKLAEQFRGGEENIMQLSWGSCYEYVYNEYISARDALNADWDGAAKTLSDVVFKRWGTASAVRDKEQEITDKDAKEYVKELRDSAKQAIIDAGGLIFASADEICTQLRERVYPAARSIANMVKLYDKRFSEKKQKKNVLDFSDIEHLCLRLFEENDEVCERLKEKYEEILMDEYQDSNGLQEEIFKKISRGDNMFMVGDMKQSIYRFRRSDPMLFKEKSDRFENRDGAKDRKIVLSKNFRSRGEVLDSVNAVFERIMSESVGDVEYNEEQRLYKGNDNYEDESMPEYKSECWALASQPEDDDSESVEKAEIEAAFIAKRISDLKKSGYTVKTADGGRLLENRDITILMSSCRNVADIYIAALNREGIECFAESSGYFDKNEVRTVMSLIKIIQNPYQDIPLLGILRSPIGGFSDEELVKIRLGAEGYIFDGFKEYAKENEKAAEFLENLNRWRGYTKYMSCARLIWTLYEETGIYAFVGALHDGEEAQANLRLLFERAKQYENSGYKGLFHFAEYIKKLEKREEDLPAAKLVGEGHDVVKIMTIHKSKGLEFPVVFLAGCGKEFLKRQKKPPLHKELGIGLDEVNASESFSVSTIAKTAVSAKNLTESISEEERKLYVALTRAKEKLIVTGVINSEKLDGYEEKWDKILPSSDSKMAPDEVCAAHGFIDWIAPVARRDDTWHYESVMYKPYFPECDTEQTAAEDTAEEIEVEKFEYPYEILRNVPAKVSVTELKSGGFEKFENNTELMQRPEFLDEEKLTAAKKGTALHIAMQKTVPKANMDIEYVKMSVAEMVETGELSEIEAASVDAGKILKFYESELGRRLLKSSRVVRESPFETEIPLSIFEGYENAEGNILLQGVADCWFEEDDGIVLVDYKTDFYKNPHEIEEKYRRQLEWYAYALEKITKKNVKNKYIYMFFGDEFLCI